jgi:AcrR family transcriptional regulator
MTRLTRKEKQAHTRSCLMSAAARVFAKRGLQQASIDEVAEDAGFTKGAFYANFKNKEELFLAMLDERFSERIQEIESVIGGEGTTSEKARQAGDDFAKVVAADPEWERLFFEFSAYAMRNDDFREELVTRYGAMRDRIEAALRDRKEDFGFESALPLDQVAMMTCVMGNGYALEKLLEGDAVSDDLYGNMLMVFFAGLAALKHASVAAPS